MGRHDDMPEKATRPDVIEQKQNNSKPNIENKRQAFETGNIKLNPFLKRKEEAELKKKRESEDTAKVYEDFVASFEESRSFVPAQGSSKSKNEPFTKPLPYFSKSPQYKPIRFAKNGQGVKNIPTSTLTAKYIKQSLEKDEEEDEEDALAMKLVKSQKRNLDTHQDVKQDSERPSSRPRTEMAPPFPEAKASNSSILSGGFEEHQGSHDTGDLTTTNLYIGNISPKVDEQSLCREFAAYGPIASVKIMWPRTHDERERNRNCGFVSFMKRKDAEKALKALHLKDIQGHALNVGWGKPVPLPSRPYFVLEQRQKPEENDLPTGAGGYKTQNDSSSIPRVNTFVEFPEDMKQTRLIHRLIERVLKHGAQFEALIMNREHSNERFKFLFNHNSKEHIYYRWRLYSLLQGDSTLQWRTEPFQLFKGGPWWTPPDIPFTDDHAADVSDDSDDEQRERAPKGVLGKVAKQRFETIVRKVTFQRKTIAEAMMFAIDHADVADEVISIIYKSIMLPESALSVKLARLFLVSDILHNSGVHAANAWKYRQGFESQLTSVFEHFNVLYRSIRKILKAEQLRLHVSGVLDAWEKWMVFPQVYIQNLREIFMWKPVPLAQIPTSSVQRPVEQQNDVEKPTRADHGAQNKWLPVEEGHIDNSIIDSHDEIDKEPMSDLDGEPLSDVDGEPLSDVDGDPMSDVDGEPMSDPEEQSAPSPEPHEREIDNTTDMFAI